MLKIDGCSTSPIGLCLLSRWTKADGKVADAEDGLDAMRAEVDDAQAELAGLR
jgi:hypothetical protein